MKFRFGQRWERFVPSLRETISNVESSGRCLTRYSSPLKALLFLCLVFDTYRSLHADEPAKVKVEATVELKMIAPQKEQKASDVAKPGDKGNQTEVVEPMHVETISAPFKALVQAAVAPAVEPRKKVIKAKIDEAAVQAEAQNDAQAQQFIQQLKPVMLSELGFVRLICSELTPEQRKPIKASAMAGLKDAAKLTAALQNGNRVPRVAGAGRSSTSNVPRSIIRDAIAKSVKETLPEELKERFLTEFNQRIEKRKRTAILCVVARIDDQLFLTAEQRDKISESISAKWKPDWEIWTLVSSVHGGQYFPTIPDALVVPHLNAEQKTVWRGIQKNDFQWWWNGWNDNNRNDNDGWWGPDDPTDNPMDPANPAAEPAAEGLQFFGNGILEILR